MLFLIIIVIVFNLIAILIRKRMSGIEILTTTLFSLSLQVLTDKYLDIKYDLYGYFGKGLEFETLIYVFGVYPAISIIFLNYFPYRKGNNNKIFYILCWTVFAVLFEIFFLWTGTYYHHFWKLWYSAIMYPVLCVILILFHKYTRYLLKRFKQLEV